jgi:uncharacterized protein YheU (UPF0270 family)
MNQRNQSEDLRFDHTKKEGLDFSVREYPLDFRVQAQLTSRVRGYFVVVKSNYSTGTF